MYENLSSFRTTSIIHPETFLLCFLASCKWITWTKITSYIKYFCCILFSFLSISCFVLNSAIVTRSQLGNNKFVEKKISLFFSNACCSCFFRKFRLSLIENVCQIPDILDTLVKCFYDSSEILSFRGVNLHLYNSITHNISSLSIFSNTLLRITQPFKRVHGLTILTERPTHDLKKLKEKENIINIPFSLFPQLKKLQSRHFYLRKLYIDKSIKLTHLEIRCSNTLKSFQLCPTQLRYFQCTIISYKGNSQKENLTFFVFHIFISCLFIFHLCMYVCVCVCVLL